MVHYIKWILGIITYRENNSHYSARLKAHDFIKTMQQALLKLNIKVESGSDWIKAFPSEPTPVTIDCKNNPRLAMALMLISLRVPTITLKYWEPIW